MAQLNSQYVPVKECYLTNDLKNQAKRQKAFIWPKTAEANIFNCVNLELVTSVVMFLSAFDSIFHTDKSFQEKWRISDSDRHYRVVHKGPSGEIIHEVCYFDVCRFLVKLKDQHVIREMFDEVQSKFKHFDTLRNITYVNFSRVFAFLTYMIVFLKQWEANLLDGFSLEFKFIENGKMFNLEFSNEEYSDINIISKWYYPIYFRFVTMSRNALRKLINIYNIYKNTAPSCIYKKMYNVENIADNNNEEAINEIKRTEIPLEWVKIANKRTEIINFMIDKGEDFDPNFDPRIYLNDYNLDQGGFDSRMQERDNTSEVVVKKSKLEVTY